MWVEAVMVADGGGSGVWYLWCWLALVMYGGGGGSGGMHRRWWCMIDVVVGCDGCIYWY